VFNLEREVSSTVRIGAVLLAISALLSIVMFTVYLGRDIATDSIDTTNRMVSDVEHGVLEDMVGLRNEMPMSAAYSLLRTHGNFIPVVECDICGQTTNLIEDTPCLIKHSDGLSGKVFLEVESPFTGEYNITIHEDDSWY
jgi:hypothetical protein